MPKDMKGLNDEQCANAPANPPRVHKAIGDQLHTEPEINKADLGAHQNNDKLVYIMNGNSKTNDAQLEFLHTLMMDQVTQLQMMLISNLSGSDISDEELYKQFKRSDKVMRTYFSKGFLSLNKSVREQCKVKIPSLLDIAKCDDPGLICNENIKELARELNKDLPDYSVLTRIILTRRIQDARATCFAKLKEPCTSNKKPKSKRKTTKFPDWHLNIPKLQAWEY